MNYAEQLDIQLNNNRNTTVATIHALKQSMDNCDLSTEERIKMNESISAMYRQQFDIETEIRERGREAVREDLYTILRQSADLMQDGQVEVHNGKDMLSVDQFTVRVSLNDCSKLDSMRVLAELIAQYGQDIYFDDRFGTTFFQFEVNFNWAKTFGYEFKN